MKKLVLLLSLVLSTTVAAQEAVAPAKTAPASGVAPPTIAITAETTPLDLARAAFAAQGG